MTDAYLTEQAWDT